jgi:Lamin Tail Domain
MLVCPWGGVGCRPARAPRWRVAAAVTAAVWLSSSAAPATAEDLRLSEFLAAPARDWNGDGATDARADEWVELTNAGGTAVDLGEYRIADGDSTIRIALSGTLFPGAYTLVTGQDALDWQRSVGRTATGLSLNNAGDTVRLFRLVGADTIEVDARAYNNIEGGSDRSVGRLDPLVDASWALFDELNPYTGSGVPQGTGCPPTPGFPNGCTTDAKTGTTWGSIKMRYR